ncbi:MAG: hypothetical protein P8Y14_12870 [Anaerolineales bacterium]|jgi:hypothetical protein
MENTTRRILASCVVILLVMCVCLSIATISGAGLFILNRSQASAPSLIGPSLAAQPTVSSPTVEDLKPEITTQSPAGGSNESPTSQPSLQEDSTGAQSNLPVEITRQMDEIQNEVIDLRDLQPNQPVERELLTPEQLRQRVIEDFLKDYSKEEARDDAVSLAAFGLLKPDFDLYDLQVDLLSEQVAGFYDDETKKMYIVQGEGFQGPERLTYAHEYDHALQDQNYDIENGLNFNDEACEKDTERCAAVQSLLEGDASLIEIEWLSTYASPQDLSDIQRFYSNYKSPVYDSAPAFLKEDFLFPYTYGQSFVSYLHDEGGWNAVDQAYGNPPVSTEQILHPEKYPHDTPIGVSLPDLSGSLGEGWQEVDRGVMGEWYTYLILAFGLDEHARLGEDEAQMAAAGWGGDAYEVYYNSREDETVMVLQTTWDSQKDASEFSTAFQQYADGRFGSSKGSSSGGQIWEIPGTYLQFQTNGLTTTWLQAPDSTVAAAVDQALREP